MKLDAAARKARLRAFVDEVRKAHPIENELVRRVWKAMKAAGTPITRVDHLDSEGAPVVSLRELYDEVFNLDEAYLMTADGSYIFLVMGEGYEALADYTVDLEDTLTPVNAWIEKNW